MQVFVTDPCPQKSATRLWNNPKRAIKMITESQQILAACQQVVYGKVTIFNKSDEPFATPLSRINHPVIKWASSSKSNMKWILMHLINLGWEYRKRYQGRDTFKNLESNIEVLKEQLYGDHYIELTENFFNFAKAADKNLDFRYIENVFEAYDEFLKAQGA